jgi:hypothetical protein
MIPCPEVTVVDVKCSFTLKLPFVVHRILCKKCSSESCWCSHSQGGIWIRRSSGIVRTASCGMHVTDRREVPELHAVSGDLPHCHLCAAAVTNSFVGIRPAFLCAADVALLCLTETLLQRQTHVSVWTTSTVPYWLLRVHVTVFVMRVSHRHSTTNWPCASLVQQTACFVQDRNKQHCWVMCYLVRFKGFTAVTMKNAVFWDVTPCENRRFGGTYRLHHQGDKNRWARNASSN